MITENYGRVLPRDLFNEGDLLKCLGKLWIALEGDDRATLELIGDRFVIEQDPLDGSISVGNIEFRFRDADPMRLYRPLNSRDPWPLWIRVDIEDFRVFDGEGNLAVEFKILLEPNCDALPPALP